MKSIFSAYYGMSEEEIKLVWQNCLFVLDANVLLNFYRYTPRTSKDLMSILKEFKRRIWVTHQAALEYQENRPEVVESLRTAYSNISRIIRDNQNDLIGRLGEFKRHPYANLDSLIDSIKNACTKYSETLEKAEKNHPDLFENDTIRDELTTLLTGKIGPAYDSQRLDEIYKIGLTRYSRHIPPGFNDEKKGTPEKFGDLIIWMQIIDKAKETHKPIILISDDKKDDWWWVVKGKTIGPRPQLIEELKNEADVQFLMYSADRFMQYAQEHLKNKLKVDQTAIDEVRERREHELEERKYPRINFLDKYLNELTILRQRELTLQHRLEAMLAKRTPGHIEDREWNNTTLWIESEALQHELEALRNRIEFISKEIETRLSAKESSDLLRLYLSNVKSLDNE